MFQVRLGFLRHAGGDKQSSGAGATHTTQSWKQEMEPAKNGSHELSQGWLIRHSSAQLSPEQGELRAPSLSMFLGIPLSHGQNYTIPDSVNISSAAGTETLPAKVRIQFITTPWFNSQVTTEHCQINPPPPSSKTPVLQLKHCQHPNPRVTESTSHSHWEDRSVSKWETSNASSSV